MPLIRLMLVLLTTGAVASVTADQARSARPTWPPAFRPASPDAPVLSPADEMKTFVLPPGYRVELVASEPMIEEPVLIEWDPDGRLWVVEMRGYMQDITAAGEREPTGRISVLEDVDNDGRMDRKTVFMDNLVLPRALKVLDRGVLVAEPPNLWLARDTDGDLRVDTKDPVTNTYGRADANVEHNANGLLWAMDNRIHTSESDIFITRANGSLEAQKTLSRGQWGLSQDDVGRIFRNSNESVLHVDLVPTPYYARNGALVRTRGSYESLLGDQNEVNRVWPAHPTPGVNRGYQTGVLRDDGTLASYTAVSAPTVYRGDRLPADLRGNVFVVDPAANVVSRIVIEDDGTRLRARKAYERAEFLASTDERFRPVYLSSAPDGALYVVDMYRGIIQHRAYITEYLRDQILGRALQAPTRHGRIYRIVHTSTRRDRRPQLTTETPASLVMRLSHPNGWWRDTAQRLLIERGDRSVVPRLKLLAERPGDLRLRLHALWTLDGLDSLEADTVTKALSDPSRDVRVAGVRLAERWLRQPADAMRSRVLARMADPDWAVRQQTAASLGELPRGAREAALSDMLDLHGTDPVVVDAALSGLERCEEPVLTRLLGLATETPARAAAVAMLSATIVRRGADSEVQPALERAADASRPEWQRSALLRGAEIALLDATMPGGGGGRRNAAAAARGNQEPGARGGPGGAPAFGRRGGGRGGRAGAAPTALKLRREPSIAALAAGDGDLARRSAAILDRIEWPGKPSAAPPVAALTASEQARFDAGREIYQSLCAACHQPDGRGRDKLAPSIVGSDMAVGAPGIPIRIVLNGKEGTTGLMPPLGTVLSDDQTAAALTYIRREWGHTASPIDPAAVKAVRETTGDRTRPWTADELIKIGR